MKVANEAVQALGGAGYTKDWPVERYYRDAKLLDIGAGTNEIRRMLIGRELDRGITIRSDAMGDRPTRLIDLSHVITEGMVTYKGLPGPHICDFISREQSVANYDDGSTFQIGRIDMVANTGTYVDVPSHRFVDGKDISEVEIEAFANFPALVIRQPFEEGLAVDVAAFDGLDVRGKAVLIATGWDRHWGTDQYYHDHSFLTEAAAQWLARGRRGAGRDRQSQYRRHARQDASGTHRLARRGYSDLRAYDRSRGASARRLPILRGASKGERHGDFPVRAYAVIDA